MELEEARKRAFELVTIILSRGVPPAELSDMTRTVLGDLSHEDTTFVLGVVATLLAFCVEQLAEVDGESPLEWWRDLALVFAGR